MKRRWTEDPAGPVGDRGDVVAVGRTALAGGFGPEAARGAEQGRSPLGLAVVEATGGPFEGQGECSGLA